MALFAQHRSFLLQFPPEILGQVMHHLGSSYFREDTRRLAICKEWLPFARASLYAHLILSQNTLTSLLSSQYTRSRLHLIEKNTTILELRLRGFDDWASFPEYRLSARHSSTSALSYWDGPSGREILTVWTAALNEDLSKVAAVVSKSTKLRQLSIQATSEHCSKLPTLPRREYLSLLTIRTLLSVQNLKVLELDLCGSQLMPGEEDHPGTHICERIGTLLLTLRRLHLRMRSICPDILKPPQAKIALSLSEVIINLSLSNELPSKTSWTYPSRCGLPSSSGFLTLQGDIEAQAKALVARMVAPSVVRILTHSFPKLEMQSLNVLTGKRMIIADDSAWDGDGEVIEHNTESEEESELESLSSDI